MNNIKMSLKIIILSFVTLLAAVPARAEPMASIPVDTVNVCPREALGTWLTQMAKASDCSAVSKAFLNSLTKLEICGHANSSGTGFCFSTQDGESNRIWAKYQSDLKFKAGAFDGLINVKSLVLPVGARSFELGSLRQLGSLQFFLADVTGMDTIPSGMFDGLSSLTDLVLVIRPDLKISRNAFSPLKALKALDITSSGDFPFRFSASQTGLPKGVQVGGDSVTVLP